MAKDVRCLSRQSERTFDAIYWFSIYKAGLGKDFMLKKRKLFEMLLKFCNSRRFEDIFKNTTHMQKSRNAIAFLHFPMHLGKVTLVTLRNF